MKQTLLLLVFIINFLLLGAQSSEFGKSQNGLIYSDTTIKQLKFIVDSLNLKFKVCELNKVYLSKLQAKAHFVYVKHNVAQAKADMENNISYDDFIKKHDSCKITKDLLVVKYKYTNYKKQEEVEFSSPRIGKSPAPEFTYTENISIYDKPLKGKWVFDYTAEDKYSPESVRAFYFLEDLIAKPLAEKYARMIQYSDCMVDTSAQVFKENAKRTGVRYGKNGSPKVDKFISYIDNATQKPNNSDKKYYKKLEKWDEKKYAILDTLKLKDPKFNALLADAVNEALTEGSEDAEFEAYVGKYYSKKAELELKRSRIVVGGCSMDSSPRYHALSIAELAAETVNWEIFLRSHLDIMNDNFNRVSDGSYAWAGRKTYIKELEILDINVLDLLLGISLRIENPSKNHYYGSIARIGRALSETEKATEIEQKMLEMIADNDLDDYNRILIYYLYKNYNSCITEENKKVENTEKLALAIKSLPNYLSSQITVE